MAGVLESLAAGLRQAGGVLNPAVQGILSNEASQDEAFRQRLAMQAMEQRIAREREQALAGAVGPALQGGDLEAAGRAAIGSGAVGGVNMGVQLLGKAEDRKARTDNLMATLQAKQMDLQQRHLDKLEELRQKGADAKSLQAERLAFQQQMQQIALQARRDMLGLAASLRPAPAPSPVTIADPNDPNKTIVVDAKSGQKIGDAPKPAGSLTPEQKITYNAGVKEIGKEEATITSASQVANALKRFQDLNAEVTTGRVSGMRPAVLQPKLQELVQLQNWLQVNNFKPGQGQISNFERSLMKGAGPQVTNDPESNQSIIAIQLGALETAKERVAYKEDFLERNKKLLGADEKWNKYVEDNPRFVKDKSGKIVPNEKRKSWREYFNAGASAQPAPAGGSQRIKLDADGNVIQ